MEYHNYSAQKTKKKNYKLKTKEETEKHLGVEFFSYKALSSSL